MSESGLINISSAFPSIPNQFDADSGSAIPIANVLDIVGSTVANSTNAQPVFTSGSGNTVTVEMQIGAAITGAPSDSNDAGLVSFDDSQFTVDSNGYVQLIGGGVAVDTLTGDDSTEINPDGAGNIDLLGEVVANATNSQPLYTKGAGNTLTAEIQVGAAVTDAPSDSNDAGVVSFDDTEFTVDTNGFVQLVPTDSSVSGNPVPLFDNDDVLLNGVIACDLSSMGTASVINDRMYLVPIFIPNNCTLDKLVSKCGSAVAGATLRMGIYDNVGGVPTNLLVESDELASATAVIIESASQSLALTADWYWLAITVNENGGAVNMSGITNQKNPSWYYISSGNILSANHYYVASIDPSSSLPDPVVSPVLATTANLPSVFLKLDL